MKSTSKVLNASLPVFVIVSISSVGSVALAHGSKEPNCDINGQKTHVHNEKQCTKKKGTWLPTATASSGSGSGSGAAPQPSVAPVATPSATPSPAETPAK